MTFSQMARQIRMRSIDGVGFFALLTIVAGGLVAIEAMHSRYEASLLGSMTSVVEQSSNHYRVEATALQREASLHSFLNSGDERCLIEYREFQDRFFELALKFQRYAGDSTDPELPQRVSAINRLDKQWRDEFAEPALAFRKSNPERILPTALSTLGANLGNRFQAELKELRELSRRFDAEQLGKVQSHQRSMRYWTIVVVVVILLLVAAVLLLLTRNIEGPITELNHLTQVAVKGEELPFPRFDSVQELSQLYFNFHTMVRTLQERQSQLLAMNQNIVRKKESLEMMTEFIRFVQNQNNEDTICDALARAVYRVIRTGQVGVYLVHRTHPDVVLSAAMPPIGETPNPPLLAKMSLDRCPVVTSRQALPLVNGDTSMSTPCQGCPGRNEFCVPIVASGAAVGTVHVVLPDHAPIPAEVAEQVTALANLAAPTICNLRMLDHMLDCAVRDPLTGLHNRRYADEHIPMILEGERRHRHTMAIVTFDIDNFKQINDRLGHDAGDRVLMRVAETAKATVRASDMVCRIGGEEFLITLPKTDEAGARTLAEKLRLRVAEQCAEGDTPVTISVGIAIFPTHGEHYGILAKAADLALYRAKTNGKNLVEVFSDFTPDKSRLVAR